MSKLLIIGMGPLFDKDITNFGGQCLRTWCLTQPLLQDGHAVRLVTLPINDPTADMSTAALVRRNCLDFEYQAFSNLDFHYIHTTLTDVARSFEPDAIVGINSIPAWVASQLPLRVPLWADLFGYEMAEKQGQAAVTESDQYLADAWRREALIARRADKISTVSRPQLHALLGEMASIGRLNQYTFQYHFAHRIQTAYHPVFAAPPEPSPYPALRGKVVPRDAFVLLWSGGYNYWTNPQMLFEFLEQAIAGNPRIHYVSTGGAIGGYNTRTYDDFQALIDGSAFKNNYHLMGWVPAGELPGIYAESDLGLSVDEPNYETLFGARNRLNNMMAAGVPVLTTYGTEISQIIEEASCGLVAPPNDPDALAQAVLEIADKPIHLKDLAIKCREFALKTFAPEVVCEPLRTWANAPELSPDNAKKKELWPEAMSFLDTPLNKLEENAAILQAHSVDELTNARQELQAIRRNPLYGGLRWAKRIVGKKE